MNEKKYNEALEQAKKELAACGSMDCDAARLIFRLFPQLRESEDEAIRKSIVATIEQCQDDFLNPKNRDRMLAYLEKQKDQKPAEWSEEDEKMLRSCCAAIIYDNSFTYDERCAMEDWLKGRFKLLRPVKQEWSDEDEDKIMSIKSLITTGRFADTNTIRIIWDMLDSLRPQPQWKPCEEQMDSLKAARDYYMTGKIKLVGRHLGEIYEQLEKL